MAVPENTDRIVLMNTSKSDFVIVNRSDNPDLSDYTLAATCDGTGHVVSAEDRGTGIDIMDIYWKTENFEQIQNSPNPS